MTDQEPPHTSGFLDALSETSTGIRVLMGVAIAAAVVIATIGVIVIRNLPAPELGDGTTVSRACLDHFESAATAQAEAPGRTVSSVTWVGVDMSGAFDDCESLIDWRIAAGLYLDDAAHDEVDAFVRDTCGKGGPIAESATCRSLD